MARIKKKGNKSLTLETKLVLLSGAGGDGDSNSYYDTWGEIPKS